MRPIRPISFFLIAIYALGATYSYAVVDLGELKRTGDYAATPVSISASTAQLKGIVDRAFAVHGGFKLVGTSQGMFDLRFVQMANNAVRLDIMSGRPAQVQYSHEYMGRDLEDAALQACDQAVLKVTGNPGFFRGKIACVGSKGPSKEIYTSDLFFQKDKVKQITHDNSYSVTPHWSPDGRYLVYTGYYLSHCPDLYMIDLSTGKRRPIAKYQGTNTGGAFSPSGRNIAMILSSKGNAELYIADSQGKNPKRMTETKGLEASPCWSPDGRKIVFTSDRLGGPQLFIMNVADRSTSRVPTNLSGYCAEGAWNPRYPNLLAFTAACGKTFQLGLYDMNTRQARFLTKGGPGVDNLEATWLRDGRHLIFTRRKGKTCQLFILDSWTGKEMPLSPANMGSVSQADVVY